MSNPYVQKFSKAFNTGLFTSIFIVLAVLASCMPEPARAATEGDLPVICFTVEEFAQEYQSGSFNIENKSSVTIFIDRIPHRMDKVVTHGLESGDTIESTWLIEKSGAFCLLFMENLGKIHKL
jgi:hypothetical protein